MSQVVGRGNVRALRDCSFCHLFCWEPKFPERGWLFENSLISGVNIIKLSTNIPIPEVRVPGLLILVLIIFSSTRVCSNLNCRLQITIRSSQIFYLRCLGTTGCRWWVSVHFVHLFWRLLNRSVWGSILYSSYRENLFSPKQPWGSLWEMWMCRIHSVCLPSKFLIHHELKGWLPLMEIWKLGIFNL